MTTQNEDAIEVAKQTKNELEEVIERIATRVVESCRVGPDGSVNTQGATEISAMEQYEDYIVEVSIRAID